MPLVNRSYLAAFCILFCNVAGLPAQDFSGVEKALLAEMKESHTAGAAIALIQRDRVVYQRGFGLADVDHTTPTSPGMLFQIGSVTKMFTATALLSLAEQGKIKLDRPIREVMEGLPACVGGATAEQLLDHNAGMKDEAAEFGLHEESALQQFVRGWKDEYCLVEPGTGFSYSNPGYSLAGAAVETISGTAYADFLEQSIFKPLGMSSTCIRPTVALTFAVANGYRYENGKWVTVRPVADDTRYWPAGYIYTNIDDLSRFVLAILNGGKLDGKQVLSPTVVSGLLTTPVEVPTDEQFENTKYGHGLFSHRYRGVLLYEHTGSMPGYSAHVWMVPDSHAAVILLTNNEGARFRATLDAALESVVTLSASESQLHTPAVMLSAQDGARFAGKYGNRWTFDLEYTGGKLVLHHFGLDSEAVPLGNRRFLVKPPWAPQGALFLLGPDKAGKPSYLQIYLWIFKRLND